MNRPIKLLIIIFIINIFLVSCIKESQEKMFDGVEAFYGTGSQTITGDKAAAYEVIDEGPEKGGELKIFSTYPDTLNPLLTTNRFIKDALSLVFDGLVKIGSSQNPIPCLAQSWQVSGDSREVTFFLKKGVLWHDGTLFTSKDVKFTFDILRSSNFNSLYKDNVKNVSSVECIDDYSIKIRLASANVFTLYMFSFPIIQENYYKNNYNVLSSSVNMSPMGTGPYRFLSYAPNEKIEFKAYRLWHESVDNQNPLIEKCTVILEKSSDDVYLKLQEQKIDVAKLEHLDLIKYYGRSDIFINEYVDRDYEFLAFNTAKGFMAEKYIRNAFSMIFNKSYILSRAVEEQVVRSAFPINSDSIAYVAENVYGKEYFSTNTSQGVKILTDEGWKIENGVYAKRINWEKKTLTLKLLINTENLTRKKIATEIKSYMQSYGIKIEIISEPWDKYIEKINNLDYDIVIGGCRIPITPQLDFLVSGKYIGKTNMSNYNDTYMQSLLDRYSTEPDEAKRKEYLIDILSFLEDEMPFYGLFFYKNAMMYNKKIKNITQPFTWNYYYGFTDWYIQKNMR